MKGFVRSQWVNETPVVTTIKCSFSNAKINSISHYMEV